MKARSRPSTCTRLHTGAPRRGFALIVVMTLLALVVLMILSLVTMVQLALQASKASIRQAQAQQNALLGLRIAIGQIEKNAGRDQVATAIADLARSGDSNDVSTSRAPVPTSPPSTISRTDIETGYTGIKNGEVSEPATPGVAGGTRQWVGIWGNAASPVSMFFENHKTLPTGETLANPQPVLLNWLVSGNEGTPNYAVNTTVPNIGRVMASSKAIPVYSPNLTIGNLTASTTATQGNLTITTTKATDPNAGTKPAILLVGPNSVGDESYKFPVSTVIGSNMGNSNITTSATHRYVVAPLVSVNSVAGTKTGDYAFWVGDEGVKAKVNITDPYAPASTSGNASISFIDTKINQDTKRTLGQENRYRFLTTPRNAIERMAGFTNFPINSAILPRILQPAQITSVDTSLKPIDQESHFHDYTTYSYGVLADSQRGGLRYDLTSALERTEVYNSSDKDAGGMQLGLTGRKLLPDGLALNDATITTTASKLNASPLQGPKWEMVKTFYDAGNLTLGVGGVQMRPVSATQSSIAPIVVQGRLQFGFYIDETNQSYIATYAIFVLANPYNFKLVPVGDMDLQFSIGDFRALNNGNLTFNGTNNAPAEWGISMTSRTDRGGAVPTVDVFSRKKDPGYARFGDDFGGYFPILTHPDYKNSAQPKGNANDDRAVLDNMVFRIRASDLIFEPGQAKVYSLGPNSSDVAPPVPSGWPAKFGTCIKVLEGLPRPGSNSEFAPLAVGLYADTYVLTKTGVANPAGGSVNQWGHLGYVLPAVACNLEMRRANTPKRSENGTQIYRAYINLDLTGAPVNFTSRTDDNGDEVRNTDSADYFFTPVPNNGYRRIYGTESSTPRPPKFIGAYLFWLATPQSDTFFVGDPGNEGGTFQTNYTDVRPSNIMNYRTYADYNLRASNIVFPPWSPFNAGVDFTGSAPVIPPNQPKNASGGARYPVQGFPTVPPYGRGYFQGYYAYGDERTESATNNLFTRNMGSGRWGYTTLPSGQENTTLFSLPQRNNTSELPVISLGELQHADLSADDDYVSVSYQPGNAFGNSFYSPHVERTRARVNLPRLSGNGTKPTVGVYDMSYLLNTLWDRYYFSAIPYASASTLSSNTVIESANPRLKYAVGQTPTIADLGASSTGVFVKDAQTGQDMFKAYAPASYQMIDGAFNINSTSVEAWRTVLSAMRNVKVNEDTSPGTSFLRNFPSRSHNNSALASYRSALSTSTTALGGNNPLSYAGFRKLTDAQIDALAVAIVQQIRLRGPFLSLQHFINRRLSPVTDPASRAGVLQTALEVAKLNELTENSLQSSSRGAPIQKIVNEYVTFIPRARLLDKTTNTPYQLSPNSLVSDLTSDTNYDKATYSVTNPGNRLTGIPGWLTQADILQALGPIISARSDTFIIRAYGDSVDHIDGRVASRVWCEAVVQRMPNFIDPVNHPATPAYDTKMSLVNKLFGRQFHILSFRWLNADDI